MEKILRRLIEYGLRGVDTYTHNGSTWLIFTDNKQWVIELTDNKTLWYNYIFFKQLFCVATDDVVENQKHITKWVEDNVINKELTYVTLFRDARDRKQQFEDALENGIKSSIPRQYVGKDIIDKIIDKDVIETHDDVYHHKGRIDGVIKNGVKETINWSDSIDGCIDNVINDGVKETHREICEYKNTIDYIIQTGVKETKTPGNGDLVSYVEWMEENKSNSYPKMIDDVIENGVKKTMAGNYTDPSTSLLHIKWEAQIEDVIDNGNKVCGTYVGGQRQKENIESVIGYGTKKPHRLG